MEDIIASHCHDLFKGCHILDMVSFRVTRDSDLDLEEMPGLKTYLERKGKLPEGLVLGLAAITTYYKGGVRADGAEIVPNEIGRAHV